MKNERFVILLLGVLGLAACESTDPAAATSPRDSATPDADDGASTRADATADTDVDGGVDADGRDASGACATGEIECDGHCVDPSSDPRHCGACSATCGSALVCSNGTCAIQCGPGTSLCGARCVDHDNDPRHCGACDVACAAGEVCSAGTCAVQCAGGTTYCSGKCVDAMHDPKNCGGCGNTCSQGTSCVNGVCSECGDTALTKCSLTCVNLQTSLQHCGTCFHACLGGATCVAGACACPSGTSSCEDRCVDTKVDHDNCGGCGLACSDAETCSNGSCTCSGGATSCNGRCVLTAYDSQHCGGCNKPCARGSVCTAGICAPAVGDWRTLGGDIQHSGTNIGETGTPPLTRAWSRKLNANYSVAPAHVSVAEGEVCFAVQDLGANVTCLNASDGRVVFTQQLTSAGQQVIAPPSIFNGSVTIATHDYSEARIHRFGLDGALRWSVARTDMNYTQAYFPIEAGGALYHVQEVGRLVGLDASDGSERFALGPAYSNTAWTAAWHAGDVYSYTFGVLRAYDAATGAQKWNVQVQVPWPQLNTALTAPVFGSAYAFVIAEPNLYAIDPVAKDKVWSASGYAQSYPAVVGNVVLARSASTLIARDATTGAALWSYVAPEPLTYGPVVAAGTAYVSGFAKTYAIDLSSHSQVWSTPHGGALAIGNHRLVIFSEDGRMEAFALTVP